MVSVPRRRPFRQMGNDLCRELTSAIPNSKRYQQNGYNLDLACFEKNRLVVMAWPADDQIFMKDMKRSKLIRNDATEVHECLGQLFPTGFKVYNLCSESKSFQRVDGVDVVQFGWIDHEPPPFPLLIRLIANMYDYLGENAENGIAIHCKAGKGRTGTATSAFLLHSAYVNGSAYTSGAALSDFSSKRFGDRGGVTIASQLRYVQYYEQYMKRGMKYEERTIRLTKLQILFKTPLKESKKDEYHKDTYKLQIKQYNHSKEDGEKRLVVKYDLDCLRAHPDGDDQLIINMEKLNISVTGDVKFKLVKTNAAIKLSRQRNIAVFWANTAFVDGPSICIDGDEFDVKKDNRMLKVDKVRFHFEDEIAASTPPPTPPAALTSAQSDGTSPL